MNESNSDPSAFHYLDFAQLQPHAVLYANALAGGAEGSWRLGNETEGEFVHLTPAILADLQHRAGGPGQVIVSPECPLAMKLYRQTGSYREVTRPDAPVWLVLPLGHNADTGALRLFTARPPNLVYRAGGVPLLQVYRLR